MSKVTTFTDVIHLLLNKLFKWKNCKILVTIKEFLGYPAWNSPAEQMEQNEDF